MILSFKYNIIFIDEEFKYNGIFILNSLLSLILIKFLIYDNLHVKCLLSHIYFLNFFPFSNDIHV